MTDEVAKELSWTGERLIATCRGQILHEHLHRYALAATIASGKHVLDIACGEGYGSNLLAEVGTYVIGVDIDADVIAHARRTYRKENISFREGSCLEIPLEDRSVDLVVSFETIEHIGEHEQFLKEIKRVLTVDGALMISSPDKREYTDRIGNKNPFHRSELYHEDFQRLLKHYFKECRLGKQRMVVGSWIAPDAASGTDTSGTFSGDIRSVDFHPGVRSGVYSIALCSDTHLPPLKPGVFENRRESENTWTLLERYSDSEHIQNAITTLEHTVRQQEGAIASSRREVEHRFELLESARQRNETSAKLIAQLDSQARQREETNAKLIAQLESQARRQLRELTQLRERFVQTNQMLHRKSISLTENEARGAELSANLRRQLQVTKKLLRLLDDVQSAAERLRSSGRWKLANPIGALKAMLFPKRPLSGYGHLEKIVSAYSKWRTIHSARNEIDDAIQALAPRAISSIAAEASPRHVEPRRPTKPILFRVHAEVEISIIIPVFNQLHFTQACLAAIQEHEGTERFEVIVVDDGSTDATAEMIGHLPGVVYLRNERNAGFIASCNNGAAKARGSFLVFLNNDTEVTPGWLGALRETFEFEPRAGLVGAKLIFPDGRLQEAGGIIWGDGSGWNRGKFKDPQKPEYNFLREVDYCSAACLMVRKALFESVGGFDSKYAPAYYEDTDLAFKVRALGYKVLYQPFCAIIHFEGATSGTDLSSGAKKYQETNRTTFAATWSVVLAEKPANGDVARSEALKPGQKRILVIDHHLPMPDRDSGSLRMFQILKILQQLGHRITFIPDNVANIPPYAAELQKRGIEVFYHPYVKSVRQYLEEHGHTLDVVILSRCDFAKKYIADVRLHAPQSRIIFDTVDLHFLRQGREAEVTQDAEIKSSASAKHQLEYALIDEADETWVVSAFEQKLLREERPEKSIQIVSNIVDVHGSATPFSLRGDFLFIGSFQHTPNSDAVIFFTKEIYPLVRQGLPDAKFYIIGDKAPPSIIALGDENIIIAGHQPDVRPYFDCVKLSVAPLRFGAGVKGKINQSMGFGTPVVATSIAVEGMDLRDREDVLIADTPADFARALIDLYQSEELWERVSRNGLEKTKALYSRDVAQKELSRLLSDDHLRSSEAAPTRSMAIELDRRATSRVHNGATA